MSLISDTQRKSAQEPKPKVTQLKPPPQPPLQQSLDEPVGSQVGYQENFVNGTGELGFEQLEQPTLEPALETAQGGVVPTQVELDNLSASSLTTYSNLEGTGKVSTSVPEAPVGVTPPINLWKDSQRDYGIPNLYDNRLLSTTSPTLYAAPLNPGTSLGANNSFNQAASRYLLTAQERQANERASKVNFDLSVRNAPSSRNTPDAEKPWHEQAWQSITGVTKDFFFGTPEAQAGSDKGDFNPLGMGTYGKHGAGIGGALKYALSVPIGVVNEAQYQGNRINRSLFKASLNAFGANDPTPLKDSTGRVRLWKELSELEKEQVFDKVNNRVSAVFGAPATRTSGDRENPLQGFGRVFTGKVVADDINDPNPELPGVIVNKKTGTRPDKVARAGRTDAQLLASGDFRRATAYAPKGRFYSQTRRPGTNAFEDPQGLAYEVANQLFSPGNKIDFLGNLIGEGVAKVGGSAIRRVFGKPAKKAVGETVAKAPVPELTSNLGKVTQITAVPLPTGGLKAGLSPEQLANVPKLPGELVAEVGLGTPGQAIEFAVNVVPRNHDDLIKLLSTGTESQRKLVSGYTGKSWVEWQQFAAKNGLTDPSDLSSVGSVSLKKASAEPTTFAELLRANAGTSPDPTNLARGFFRSSTLDDLVEQSADLASHRSVLDSALESLEKVFDTTVDVGRRALDNIPFKELTADDVFKALGDGTPLRLTTNAFDNLPEAVVKAIGDNDTDTIAKLINDGSIDDEVVQTFVNNVNSAIKPPSTLSVVEEAPATKLITFPAPTEVYHGTALKQWTPDYNVREFGSRGELGSGTYTTIDKYEAGYYARASVGDNVSVEVKYEPIKPQVFALDTSSYKATLDANASLRKNKDLVRNIVDSLPTGVREPVQALFTKRSAPTLVDLMSRIETVAAKVFDSSEGGLKRVNDLLSEGVRKSGYDSIYDKKSGWFLSLDNSKFRVKTQSPVPAPASSMEAAIARYNADSKAAASYSKHITSDANLRDSAYQVLDQARVEVDEWLEAVQREAVTRIANTDVESVVKVVQEPPSPANLDAVVELASARTSSALELGLPEAAEATAKSAFNDIKIVELAGAAPEVVLKAQVDTVQALTKAPTSVVEAAVKKAKAKPMNEAQVSLSPTTYEGLSGAALRELAKEKGVDTSTLGRLSPKNKVALVEMLKQVDVSATQVQELAAKVAAKPKELQLEEVVQAVKATTSEPASVEQVAAYAKRRDTMIEYLRPRQGSKSLEVKQRKLDEMQTWVKEEPTNPEAVEALRLTEIEVRTEQLKLEPVDFEAVVKQAQEFVNSRTERVVQKNTFTPKTNEDFLFDNGKLLVEYAATREPELLSDFVSIAKVWRAVEWQEAALKQMSTLEDEALRLADDLASNPVPVNPHSSIREALTDAGDNICDF
jgi:hypothetical protein